MTRVLVVSSWLVAVAAFADDLPTVKVVKGAAPKGLAPSLADLLADESYAIHEEGKEVLHVWIRKEIPSTGQAGEFVGADTIEDGAFVGVYEVKEESFTDFRGQDLTPGVYTLRMASHPQDGNHMGVAPTPQFLCLVRVSEEKSADPIERDELMELSKKAAGTGHPAALYVEPFFEAPKTPLPGVRQNDLEHVALDVPAKALLANGEKAELPLALIFIGTTDAE